MPNELITVFWGSAAEQMPVAVRTVAAQLAIRSGDQMQIFMDGSVEAGEIRATYDLALLPRDVLSPILVWEISASC